jgi:Nuclease-related domain
MAKLPKTKSQSLRHPGQSLDEKIDRVVLDDFMGYYLLAAGLWLLAILEWLSKVFHYPRMPVAYAVAAVAATVLCVVKFARTKRELRSLRQGRDGEREVAEILDELKRYGAEVLHDIPEEQGNVDHVVICTRGIFVIETKNWSKPDKVWEMHFDGEQIHIPTRAPDAAPIIQCKAEAASIKSLLRDSTSKSYPVRGVVVFLDWFVKRKPAARGADIWVLNPKELAGWIRKEPEILSDSDVAMATLHLKQYVKKLAA